MDISKHAKERYAERLMSYSNGTDVNKFILEHEDKIKEDLNKMVQYGDLLYSGKSLKDGSQLTDIYLKDTWVLLVDKNKNLLITVYKIDLKVDEEFSKEYVKKIISKLNAQKELYSNKKEEIDTKIKEYRDIITNNDIIISEYRKTVKSLEEQNETYKHLIQTSNSDLRVLEDEIRNTLMILTGNKVW